MILFWHRRDLRIEDNAGLYKALKSGQKVQPIFIFDSNILEELPATDQRVLFIYNQIKELKNAYRELGSDLWVLHGIPETIFESIIEENTVEQVFTNRDYEPYALSRDKTMFSFLKDKGIEFNGAKDHVIFEKEEVLKGDGTPYRVFTPYMRKWREKCTPFFLSSYPTLEYTDNLHSSSKSSALISLKEMGFPDKQTQNFPPKETPIEIVKNYHQTRDIPAQRGTSRLSIHLRFGTISIRQLCREVSPHEKYLNEIIWRDFYQMIIYHFPHSVDQSFKPKYDQMVWENNQLHFKAWCEGKTGYPMVDAGMRELNSTGFMHNRVRMIVASFLTKHLLIDWRWGEAYFAEKLLDFELASNVGGWQWAASSGVDAQPYFRIFNPESQQKKFDPELEYIHKWIPEYGTKDYPSRIVEHKEARKKALEVYGNL